MILRGQTRGALGALPWLLGAVLGVALGTGPARPVQAAEAPPDGWKGAKFRMSVEEVRALFPGLETTLDSGEPKDAVESLPRLVYLEKKGVSVLDQEGCTVRFQFAADQLYFINFHCPNAKGSLKPLLTKRYGDPTLYAAGVSYWQGMDWGVAAGDDVPSFGFYDRQLDKLVQQAMLRALDEQTRARIQAALQQQIEEARRKAGSATAPAGKAGAEGEAPSAAAGSAGADSPAGSKPARAPN